MTYSLYFKKDNKDNKYGHIYIMKIENRIKSYRSLKIKIPTNLWNEKHKQVRVTDKLDYISINKQIKSEIENCTKNISIKKNTDSFISFFEQYNTTIANEGSKEKYKQVLAKLKKVYSELLFCDFNYSVVLNLNKVFRETLTVNTSNHYLKQIKKILDFAIKLDIINYLRHPFLGFEFKNEKVGNDSLNIQEVQAIINIQDNKLAVIRDKFIFQIFAQGMRVSDLFLLKWENIKITRNKDIIEYVMFKTGKKMNVELNQILINILKNRYDEFVNNPENKSIPENIIKIKDSIAKSTKTRNELLSTEYNILSGFETIISSPKLKELDEVITVEMYKEQLHYAYIENIKLLSESNKHKSKYIFEIINFKIENPKKMTEFEYKQLKNKTIIYNRELKLIGKFLDIKTNVTSHLARHTYASLLLNNSTDLYTISQSLGHSKVAITEKYLSKFDTSKTHQATQDLVNKFSY